MSSKLIPKTLNHACEELLVNKKIRYVGILDRMGNSIFEREQEGVKSLISDKTARSLYIKSVLEVLFQKDFDNQIGLLKYNVSHREKIDVITIPLFNNVILITVNPNENCDVIANGAIKIFEKFF